MRLTALLLVALALVPVSLDAQYDSTTVVGRAILRRSDAIGQDPAIQGLAEAGVDLFGDGSSLQNMDDSTMVLMVKLMADWMTTDEPGTCRAFTSHNGEDGFNLRLAQVTDSLEGERWADVFERILWRQVSTSGPQEVTSPEDMQAWVVGLVQNLSEEERAKFTGGDEDRTAATCAMLRLLFTDLASKSAVDAGPMLRALMNMGLNSQ